MEQEHRKPLQYAFGDFVLRIPEASLTCRGESVPLAPKEFDLLCVLASHAGHLVQKEILVKTVWPDTFVSDSSLFRNISVLRRYLGDDAIRTVPKRGYVFTVPVTEIEASSDLQVQNFAGVQNTDPGGLVGSSAPFPIDLRRLSPIARHRSPSPRSLAVAIPVLAILVFLALQGMISRTPHAGEQSASRAAGAQEAAAGAARLFLLNEHGNSLSVLNTLKSTVESTMPMDADPRGAAILPDGSAIYVSLYHAGRVVAFDTKNHRMIAVIPVGNSPVGVAANPRPPYLYVANNYSNSVSVIDSRTNKVVRQLNVGNVPTEIGISADGTRGIVTNQSGGSITVIDSVKNSVLETIPVGSTPVGIAFTPDSRFAWITLAGENGIAVLDITAGQVVHRIRVGPGPVRVAMTRDGRFALVSDFFSDTLTVVDTRSFQSVAEIPVGLNPVGIALDPTGELAYVANYGSNTVSVVDLRRRSVIQTISAGASPVEVAVLACYANPCG